MKFGRIEIRLLAKASLPILIPSQDLTDIFAVSDKEPWWLAVHQAINEVEHETVEAARSYILNTNKCLSAVGAGEGCAMVRMRLGEKRELALREKAG